MLIGRKRREWFPGATYHVMTRGIRRQEIFRDAADRQLFLFLAKKYVKKYGGSVHAYCLMTNHIHMLIETYDNQIGVIMQSITGVYAKNFNYKYGYKGHLYEDRFKSCLVKSDAYFLKTSRYIHVNPVKAQMVRRPEDYKWSSYRTLLGIEDDMLTEREKILSYFHYNPRKYQEFVEDIENKYTATDAEIYKEMEEDEIFYGNS